LGGVGSGNIFFNYEPSTDYSLPDETVIFQLCFELVGEPQDCDLLQITDLPLAQQVVTSESNGEDIGLIANDAETCILFPPGYKMIIDFVEGERGDTVCVPFSVVNFVDIVGTQFCFNWDPASLAFESINLPGTWPDFTAANFDISNQSVGVICVDWTDGPATIPDSTAVFEVCYELIGEPRDCYPISIVDDPDPVVTTVDGDGSLLYDEGELCINDKFVITDVEITPVSCPGSSDGRIEITVEGGLGIVGTSWSHVNQFGDTTRQFTQFFANNLPEGELYLTIYDQASPEALILKDTFIIPLGPNIPEANAGEDQVLVCPSNTILVMGTGSMGDEYSYDWNRINGAPYGDALNFVANVAGDYVLAVTNDLTGCTIYDTMTVVNPLFPEAYAGVDDIINCYNDTTVVLSGIGSTADGVTYLWTPLDTIGEIVPGEETLLNPTITAPGEYQLMVTFTDNSCFALDTVIIEDEIVIPSAEAGLDAEIGCGGDPATLHGSPFENPDLPNVSYAWYSATGGLVSGNIDLVSDILGTYTFVVTNEDSGCTASDEASIIPNEDFPQIDAGEDQSLNCAVDTIFINATALPDTVVLSISWDVPVGGSIVPGTETGLTPQITAPGFYTLSVTNPDNGCTATDVVEITQDIEPPVLLMPADTLIDCTNVSVVLDASGSSSGSAFTSVWTLNEAIVATDTLLVDATTAGTYYLEITNTENHCVAIDSVVVDADATAPIIGIEPFELFLTCTQTSLDVTPELEPVGGNFTTMWSTDGGLIDSDPSVLTLTTHTPGTYQIVVTNDDNGCTSNNEVFVEMDTIAPVANAGDDQMINCIETVVTLDGSGSTLGDDIQYVWSPIDGGEVVGMTADVSETGIYLLTATDTLNGCFTTDEVEVGVDTLHPTVVIAEPDKLTCLTQCVPLDATGSLDTTATYLAEWTGLDGIDAPTPAGVLMPTACGVGTYQLVLTNLNGCQDSATIEVIEEIILPEIVFATPPMMDCDDTTVSLDASEPVEEAVPSRLPRVPQLILKSSPASAVGRSTSASTSIVSVLAHPVIAFTTYSS